ncbi:protein kinase domain-containing protein [Pendulispora albinea]|uniref:Serine/threonine protein kinase n=1 Tax=Pendulispora albinea TaxID=2741071 RepID=A0ABZ2M812_9BACT
MHPHRNLVGSVVGSYRLTRLLGEGGVGVVYLGEHPLVGARVAIKVLHEHCAGAPEIVERFVNEAKAANLIQSPHIVRVSDFGCLDDGSHYAVMEYLEGQTLEHILSRIGPMEYRRVVELCRQMAVGMSAAHAAGIIHRDLKPANVFVQFGVEGGPFVRILDFGIAKLLESNWQNQEPAVKSTLAGQVLGTPLYCSPEQAAGEPVTKASDVYALGAIAYELLSGVAPIEGENLMQILVRKATLDAVPIASLCPQLPVELAELVMEMLARKPASRPGSMDEVVRRLDAIVPPAPSRPSRPSGRMSLQSTLVSPVSPLAALKAVPRLNTPTVTEVSAVGIAPPPSSRAPTLRRGARSASLLRRLFAGAMIAVVVLGAASFMVRSRNGAESETGSGHAAAGSRPAAIASLPSPDTPPRSAVAASAPAAPALATVAPEPVASAPSVLGSVPSPASAAVSRPPSVRRPAMAGASSARTAASAPPPAAKLVNPFD